MKIIIILILLMLQSLAAMGASVAPGVQDKDAKNELAAIAPNDFSAPLNYSYEEIDSHALNAPASAEGNVSSLAVYLAKPAKNDREKARAISGGSQRTSTTTLTFFSTKARVPRIPRMS